MRVLAFMNLGPTELIIILLVALLVFGRKLPEVARGLGQGLTEFRKGLRDEPEPGPKPLPPKEETKPADDDSLEDDEPVSPVSP